ncbi:Aldolase-type TIM barrel [Niveomyces insectorum RCEF 264]|uniref:Aldolase-type TIM barrel n=1 Tax=Niveomyces insectorum RCEF 264 TaxID=1081102 RepID=A0A168AC44_9HYPO|nr:Aldolase-type TIM barrel [Niveomyces insectorum RCEF 264]
MDNSRLFKPTKLGAITLQHRVGMCPLTRFRASAEHVPTPSMVEYYEQRGSVPGTLLVTEGTFISAAHGGYNLVPGIWNTEQIAAWRRVTDAVHRKGSYIFCQLWALGRTADPAVLARSGSQLRSSSSVPMSGEGRTTPLAMTADEIQEAIDEYAAAAKKAIDAGFDGIELHGANGYLIDQFIQDVCNKRTDEWGGSVENRSRFAVEVTKAVSEAIGPDRVGIRLSPWSTFQDMRMADPVPQFSDILTKLNPLNIAYVHVVEARVSGNADIEVSESLDFVYGIRKQLLLVAGGYSPASAKKLVDEDHPDRDIVVMFGRHFISNPDLPFRIQHGISLHPYDRKTFYNPNDVEGYTGQPFSEEFLESTKTSA